MKATPFFLGLVVGAAVTAATLQLLRQSPAGIDLSGKAMGAAPNSDSGIKSGPPGQNTTGGESATHFPGQLASIRDGKNRTTRSVQLHDALRKWLMIDPHGALAYCKAASGRERNELLAVLSIEWGRLDPKAALGGVEGAGLDGSTTTRCMGAILRGWMENDLPAATAFVSSMPFGNRRDYVLNEVITKYAVDEPQAALEWAKGLPSSRSTNQAIVVAAREFAQINPEYVASMLKTETSAEVRFRVAQDAFENWGRLAPEAALAFAGSLNDQGLNGQIYKSLYTGWAATNLDAAANAVSQLGNGTTEKRAAIAAVASALTEVDPQRAAQWLANLGNDPAAWQAATTSVVNSWMEKDSTSALAWIGGIPDIAQRDYAQAVAVGRLAVEFPDIAITMAGTIQDPRMRSKANQTILDHWRIVDVTKMKEIAGRLK